MGPTMYRVPIDTGKGRAMGESGPMWWDLARTVPVFKFLKPMLSEGCPPGRQLNFCKKSGLELSYIPLHLPTSVGTNPTF